MQSPAAAVLCWLLFAVQPFAVEAQGAICTKTSTTEKTFDCSKTGCCEDPTMTCFLKDHSWGECLPSCAKGKHDDDPKAFRTAWSCSQATPKSDKVLVKEYGQCGGKLAGQGDTPYKGPAECEEGCRCLTINRWISSCRPRVNGVACGGKHMTRVGKAVVSNEFPINGKVQAMFAGLWYNAKVDAIHEDGTYRVSWATDNYLTSTTIDRKQLRHMKEELDEEEEKETIHTGDVQMKVLSDAIPVVADNFASTRVAPMGRRLVLSGAALTFLASVALIIKRSNGRPLSNIATYQRTPQLEVVGELVTAC